MQSTTTGKVYLVGAGPGDKGLLTLKGLRCLQKADVVVYDFHINAQVLNLIDHDAELIYAGKRGGFHEMTQDEINAALVKKAHEGKTVCRLKGGDPFVFGRGAEEAQVLHEEGIEFEIVPGISSAIAVPAYAGIPLTHRKVASSFAVITGNEEPDKETSAINWPEMAHGFDTLVFLMGVKNIASITEKLLEYGKPVDTPAAVIRWGTRPDQKTVTGTLGDIARLVQESGIKPPAVMVVGKVVSLRETLNWYEKKPLFGHRVVLTRDYTGDYDILDELGAEILEFPTIEIVPPESWTELDRCIERMDTYDWLVFTSANGFKYFFNRLLTLDRDMRDLKGVRICAIGAKTAEMVRKSALKVDLVPEEFNAEGLVHAFVEKAQDNGAESLKGLRILLPRAETAREVFPERVRELGGEIDTPAAYRAINPKIHTRRLERFLKEGKVTVVTFTSAATFTNLRESIGEENLRLLKQATLAAIGPVTAKAVALAGLTVEIMPETATVKAMVDAIVAWARNRQCKETE